MSRPDRIRVAAAQYPIGTPGDVGAWRDKQARWIADGAATGAQLLVLPEYGLMEIAHAFGLRVASDLAASLAAVTDARAEIDATHAELARRHGIYLLGASGPARREGRYVNAARLHGPAGGMGTAEKVIITPFEVDWGVSGGGKPTVFETALGRIGVSICYDSEFPLLARAQVESGADILLVPSCTERISGYHRVRTGAQARALEGQIAAVVSPTVGDAPWSPAVDHNRGAAAIFVPAEHGVSDTGCLAEGVLDRAQWVTVEVDLAALRAVRASGEMRNAADWALQPGALPLTGLANVVQVS